MAETAAATNGTTTYLRVASFTYKPYHILLAEGRNVPLGGMYGKVFEAIMSSLNFEYDLRDAGSWGLPLENGSWTGGIGQLQRDEVDVGIFCMNPTTESLRVSSITPMIHPVEVAILAARKDRFLKTPFALVNGFSLEVWLLLFLATITLATGMSFMHRALVQSSNFMQLLCSYVLQLFGNTWGECAISPLPFHSLRIIWMFWLLGVTMILMNAFAGNLKGMLLFKTEMPRISSMLDLANRPKLKIYLPRNSIENILKTSDKAYVRSLYRRIVLEHRTSLPASEVFSEEALHSLLNGQAVLISSRPASAQAANAQCEKIKRGEYYTARDIVLSFNAVICLNQRMPLHLQRTISRRWGYLGERTRIMRLFDSGIMGEWYRQAAGTWTGCLATGGGGHDSPLGALHIGDLEGIFYIVLIGQTAGLLVLILEFAVYRRQGKPLPSDEAFSPQSRG